MERTLHRTRPFAGNSGTSSDSIWIRPKTRNGILSTLSVNPPRKQRMSFRQRSVTYVKSFLRAFTRENRYPTCFKLRFVSSPLQRYQKRHGGFAKPFCAKALDLRGPPILGAPHTANIGGLDSSLPQRRAGRSGAPALVKVMLDRLCDLYRPERRTGERMAIPGSLSILAQKHGSKRFKNRLAA